MKGQQVYWFMYSLTKVQIIHFLLILINLLLKTAIIKTEFNFSFPG